MKRLLTIPSDADALFVWPVKDNEPQGVWIYSVTSKEIKPRNVALKILKELTREFMIKED